jgi:HK97 family phage major capsid protein
MTLTPTERRHRIDELRRKRHDLNSEYDTLADRSSNDLGSADGLIQRQNNLSRGMKRIDDEIDELLAEGRRVLADGIASGEFRFEGGSDNGEYVNAGRGRGEDRAMRLVDAAVSRGLPDHAAETAERLLRSEGARERSKAAEWIEVTGSEDYLRAFVALLSDPERGHLTWTDREREAFSRAEQYRAMSLTDSAGGFLVPFQLDPTIMLSNAGAANPIRQLARVVQATGDTWNGVTSAGVSVEWLAEATEAADGSPTLAQPSIPILKQATFVPFSIEVGMDGANFASEVGRIMADAADVDEAAKLTTGNGTTQPQGLITGLAGTSSEINAAADDTFASGDVYALQNALGARFSAGATWQSHIAIANIMRQLETGSGAHKFPGLHESPPTLLGKRWYENSSMDSTVTTTGAVSNFILVYGDIGQAYVIADRIGTTVELVPHLFGTNRRPTGQRGFFMYRRVGAEVVLPEAARLLDVASAA